MLELITITIKDNEDSPPFQKRQNQQKATATKEQRDKAIYCLYVGVTSRKRLET